jgi:MFS family permease
MTSAVPTALPPAFRRIGWSNLAAQFSEQIALAAAPLAAVLLLGAGASETGWLQTAQTLPFLLLSIPAGLAVDRMQRRGLMVGAEAIRALSLLAILALLGVGLLSMPWLAALGFLGAIGTVVYSVSAPALLPTLIPRGQLAAANRWLELARSTAYAGGPALGGALVGWTGAPAAYGLATALSILAVMLLAGLPQEPAPSHAGRKLLHDLAEGARFVAGNALLRPILLTAILFNTAWFVLQAVYVAYAVQHLQMSATQVGMSLGIYGAGMVLGASGAPLLGSRISFGATIAIGPLAALCASCLMALTIRWPSPALANLSFFLFGAGPVLWSITTMTLRQAVTRDAMLGRVSALIMTATFGARPLGAAIGALVAQRFGASACLLVSLAGFAAQYLVIAVSAVPRLRELPERA